MRDSGRVPGRMDVGRDEGCGVRYGMQSRMQAGMWDVGWDAGWDVGSGASAQSSRDTRDSRESWAGTESPSCSHSWGPSCPAVPTLSLPLWQDAAGRAGATRSAMKVTRNGHFTEFFHCPPVS